MTKPTKLLSAQRVAKDPSFLHADSEDSDQTGRMPRLIRDWADAQADLSLRWVHMPLCWSFNFDQFLIINIIAFSSTLHERRL